MASKFYKAYREAALCFMDGAQYFNFYPERDSTSLRDSFLEEGFIKMTCWPNKFEITDKGREAGYKAHNEWRKRHGFPTAQDLGVEQ